MISDVDAVAAKIVALKSVFPRANAFNIISSAPKLLLKTTDKVLQEAEIVSECDLHMKISMKASLFRSPG